MSDLRMPEINSASIAGNLTRDPIFRHTTNGVPVVNFTLASNRRFRDSNNKWQEDVCYIGVVAWDKLADSCRDRLKKGSAVLIDGELQSRNWKSDDGRSRSIVEIKARRIQFLNRNGHQRNGLPSEEIHIDSLSREEEPATFVDDSFDNLMPGEESEELKSSLNKTSE